MERKGATVLCEVLFFVTLALVITFTSACRTTAQEVVKESIDVSGNWKGMWRSGSNAGELRLFIDQDGRGGTLAATNVPRFGYNPVPLEDIKFENGTISFRAVGADGGPLTVTMELDKKKRLSGWAQHGSSQVWFDLEK